VSDSPTFEQFQTLDFPTLAVVRSWDPHYLEGEYVYVIFWAMDNGSETPFYVGMTEKSLRIRMWDYCVAQWGASTDFWVGEAIKYLSGKGCRIVIRYQPTSEPRKAEEDLIRQLQVSGPRLINGLRRHRYQTHEQEAERSFIQRYCDLITST